MKDIKPNQEGLMSLAEKRPDVVEKMGYDPDSFAAGGIAMLEAGGMAMDPDMAMEVFKEKQGIDSFKKGGLSSILDKIKNIDIKEEDLENLVDSLELSSDILDQGTNQIISGGIGAFQAPKIPPITRMANGGITTVGGNSFTNMIRDMFGRALEIINTNDEDGAYPADNELKKLIDTFPGLSSSDKNLQKAIIDLQRTQQYAPDSAQYIDKDSPLKAIYRPYYSEVTKAYNVGRPGKFDPMAAAPEERVQFNLKPRRIAGQLYAADGMMVDGQMFPDRDDLVTGPGGERDDKIPAMLSDGEFITNAKAVRGIGALAGAPADDPFAQRMEGAKQMYALQKAAEEYMGMM